jgi:hypothetical protein
VDADRKYEIAVHFNSENMQTELTLQDQIEALKAQLTGDLFADMDIKNGVKPMDSHFDCVGCGS